MDQEHQKLRSLWIIALLFSPCFLLHSQDRLSLQERDVVVFLGATNMLHGLQSGYLEAILTKKFADKSPRFLDFSWEADTVFRLGSEHERWRTDGLGNLDRQLENIQANVIIAQFGKLEAFAGLSGLENFSKSYGQLISRLKNHSSQMVLLSPTPFYSPTTKGLPDLTSKNDQLKEYVVAIRNLAEKHDLVFVDLFSENPPEAPRQKTSSDWPGAQNGLHVGDEVQPWIANHIAVQLGFKPWDGNQQLLAAIREKNRLWNDYWRPANWKLLFGDDSKRQFTKGIADSIPFREEWKKLLPLISTAENRILRIARNESDPGLNRPPTEILHGDPQASIPEELKSFKTLDGFEINLFASEKEGLTSPLAIRWDPAGRMYVSVTTTYPHVRPGDLPNDKIIIIEDTNQDGVADKSTLFADGLNIPTGIELGMGGVFVGQNTELLFLKDTDGDLKADTKKVLLSGFGNGDSHQTINSFVWSPGGELYFGQGDGCESRVETPWGTSELFQAGFFRLRPERMQLHPLLDDFMGPGNPWGVAFNEWGQIFSVDGAGGITFLSPGQIPTTHRRRLRTIGKPGGYCGIGFLDGRHLPADLQGHFAIGDYKSNQVKQFAVRQEGAGFSLHWKSPLVRSTHRNFRPIDVKVGPDGAIYIVDWYNPVTCHQDDAYRDPTRDKAHGRIWRLSTKSKPIRPVNLEEAAIETIVAELSSPESWTRYQAKRELTRRDRSKVITALDHYVTTLHPDDVFFESQLHTALSTFATLETVRPSLLRKNLESKNEQARAYAARLTGRWHDRLDNPLGILRYAINDAHPLVRLEAVLACAAVPDSKSIRIAAEVVSEPIDEWINYAFRQAIQHLKPYWEPEFSAGKTIVKNPNQLAVVLNESVGKNALQSMKKIASDPKSSRNAKQSAFYSIFSMGSSSEFLSFGLEQKRFTQAGAYAPQWHSTVLRQLVDVAKTRSVKPDPKLTSALGNLLQSDSPTIRKSAIQLAGLWGTRGIADQIRKIAENPAEPHSLRSAALEAAVQLMGAVDSEWIYKYAVDGNNIDLRASAIMAIVKTSTPRSIDLAVDLLVSPDHASAVSAGVIEDIMIRILDQENGGLLLASALQANKIEALRSRFLLKIFFSTGRTSPELYTALNKAAGGSSIVPEFQPQYLKDLAAETNATGDEKIGELIFSNLSCQSCHRLGENGAAIGPSLAAVGTTLSTERIAEEILWPNRQVKEGYTVIQVLTKNGLIRQGYQRRSRESERQGNVVMQDIKSRELIRIHKNDIEAKKTSGSNMPSGLTNQLNRKQLVDLLKFLSVQGQQN